MTILVFGTLYALLLLGIAYVLMLNLLDRMQVKVVVSAPVQIEGDALRLAIQDVSHQVFSGTSLLADVVRSR